MSESISKDELQLISNKLTFSPDYIRFRSVCKSWRSSAPKRLQLPWLIERDQFDHDRKLTFFKFYQLSFETNKFLPIPELSALTLPPSNSQSASASTNSETDCIGYSHGWMALFNRSTSSVSLFNPLTNSFITLPVLKIRSEWYPIEIGDISLHLTSHPGEPSSNCFALVNVPLFSGILYCKVGCSGNWVEMSHPEFVKYRNGIQMCIYRGKTFILSHCDVFVCDFGLFGCNQISLQKIISFSENSHAWDRIGESYLVESDGNLLLVLHRYLDYSDIDEDCSDCTDYSDTDEICSGHYFQIFKLEFRGQAAEMVLVKSLGDKALLLASPRSIFSVTASKYPGCKRNTIYTIRNDAIHFGWCTQHLCIYDFEDGWTETGDDGDPPFYVSWRNCGWFSPSLLN